MSKAKIEKAPALNLPHDFELIAPFVLSEQYGITDEKGRYLHWSQLKWRLPREQAITIWKAIKFKRISQSKPLGLSDEKGMPFVYCNAPAMDAILH